MVVLVHSRICSIFAPCFYQIRIIFFYKSRLIFQNLGGGVGGGGASPTYHFYTRNIN